MNKIKNPVKLLAALLTISLLIYNGIGPMMIKAENESEATVPVSTEVLAPATDSAPDAVPAAVPQEKAIETQGPIAETSAETMVTTLERASGPDTKDVSGSVAPAEGTAEEPNDEALNRVSPEPQNVSAVVEETKTSNDDEAVPADSTTVSEDKQSGVASTVDPIEMPVVAPRHRVMVDPVTETSQDQLASAHERKGTAEGALQPASNSGAVEAPVIAPMPQPGLLSTPPVLRNNGGDRSSPVSWAPTNVKVELSGGVLQASQFGFTMNTTDGAVKEATNDMTGGISFDPLQFGDSDIGKTVEVRINQKTNAPSMIKIDNKVLIYELSIGGTPGDVTVTETSAPTDPTFHNVWNDILDWTPSAEIVFSAGLLGLETGQFEFSLEQIEGPDPFRNGQIVYAKNDNNGKVFFPDVHLTPSDDSKVFTYKIKQVLPEDRQPNVNYDASEYTLKATVSRESGHLAIHTAVFDQGGSEIVSMKDLPVRFTNTYESSCTFSPEVTVRLYGGYLSEDEFEFELYKKGDSTPIATAKNDIYGTVKFYDAVSYDETEITKEFKFEIKQKIGSDTSVKYDNHTYEFSVFVIVDKNNDVSTYVVPVDHEKMFFNNSRQADNAWIPMVRVDNQGMRPYVNDQGMGCYQFKMDLDDGSTFTRTVRNDASGAVNFEALYFNPNDDGYDYNVNFSMVVPADPEPGVTYDTSKYQAKIHVSVVDDKYTLTTEYYKDGVATTLPFIFKPTYTATGEYDPKVNVELLGRKLKGGDFNYIMTGYYSGGKIPIQILKNDADGRVPFAKIDLKSEMIDQGLDLIIQQVPSYPYEKGLTLDPREEIVVHLDVQDIGSGKLAAYPVDESEPFTFRNTYKAQGSWTPDLRAALIGRTMVNREFTFKMTGQGIDESASVQMDGQIDFGTIDYDQDDIGTHVYWFSQVIPSEPENSMEYDGETLEAQVDVYDAGDGVLATKVTYDPRQVFVNTFRPYASWVPDVRKELNIPLQDSLFKFELKDESSSVLQTAYNNDAGVVGFEPIVYSDADVGKEFTYTITEVDEGTAGYTYDATVHTIKVKVEKGKTGKITVTPSITDPIVFKNTYTATGSFTGFTDVVLENGNLTNGQFTFRMTQDELGYSSTKTNDASGHVTFDPLPLNADQIGKTLRFDIEQIVDAPDADISYDMMKTSIFVAVRDDQSGSLVLDALQPKDNVFNNLYKKPGFWSPFAFKALDGRRIVSDEFSFVFHGDDVEGNDITREAKVKNDGSITFEPIEFTQKDKTYTFWMYEKVPVSQNKGIDYDTDPRKIKVRTYQDSEGIQCDIDYSEAGNGEFPPMFENRYRASGSWNPLLEKMLQGRPLKDGEFTFDLTDADRGLLMRTATNDEYGSIGFEPLTFDQSDIGKIFHYTVTERSVKEAGLLTDPVACRIELFVKDAGDGDLSFDAYYSYNKFTFVNQYLLSDTWSPKAAKKLFGRFLHDDDFHFQLKEGNTVVREAWNDSSGNIYFDPIKYGEGDVGKTFIYTMSEVKGTEPHMIYDNTIYTYTIKVEKNDEGEIALRIKSSLPIDPVSGTPVFENKIPHKGSWTPASTVSLDGRALKANEFEFVLEQITSGLEDDPILPGGIRQLRKNSQDGTMSWDAISYDETDIDKVYYYRMAQIIPTVGETGITYDKKLFIAQVNVYKGAELGKLDIQVSWAALGKPYDAPAFVNKFVKSPTPAPGPEPKPTTPDGKPIIQPTTPDGKPVARPTKSNGRPVAKLTPGSQYPATGENPMSGLYVVLLMAVAGAAVLIFWKRRHRES